MAALTMCDELLDAGQRIRALEDELKTLRDVRVAAVDRAKATQTAVANALNAAAERIGKTTLVLNPTIGGGVAIGEGRFAPLENCSKPPTHPPQFRPTPTARGRLPALAE